MCVNFAEHEDLDAAQALLTTTVASDGSIAGLSLSASGAAGVVPMTVPTSLADQVGPVASSCPRWWAFSWYAAALEVTICQAMVSHLDAAGMLATCSPISWSGSAARIVLLLPFTIHALFTSKVKSAAVG